MVKTCPGRLAGFRWIDAADALVGGRLIDIYFTLGEHDFVAIAEAPGEMALLAALLPVAASGAVTDLETHLAYRTSDVAAAAQQAKSVTYRPPGKA